MGIPLMIQAKDNQKIEHLKNDLGLDKKIDAIRAGLALLEEKAARAKRIKRWQRQPGGLPKVVPEYIKNFNRV